MNDHPLLGKTLDYDGPAYTMEEGIEFNYVGPLMLVEFDGNERGQWVNAVVPGDEDNELDTMRNWLTLDPSAVLLEPVYVHGTPLPHVGGVVRAAQDSVDEVLMWLGDIFERRFGRWL